MRSLQRCQQQLPAELSKTRVSHTLTNALAVLFFLSTALKGVAVIAGKSFASQGPLQKAVQPIVAQYVMPLIQNIFGSSVTAGFTVKLEHILLAAILAVLIGIWRTNAQQVEVLKSLKKREAKEDKSAKHD